MQSFVHLRLHTEFSLIDSVVRIKPLIKAVAGANMPAVAVTDVGNLFALVKFYRAAQGAGIKPVIGAELRVKHEDDDEVTSLVLLVQNEEGYRNLTVLVSRGYREGQENAEPYIHQTWLAGNTDGLIALSGGVRSDVGRALERGNTDEATQRLRVWAELFPDRYYVELQRTGRPAEENYLHDVLPLAQQLALPVVATNEVVFLSEDEFESHEARTCIREGRTLQDPRRPKRYSPQQHLRTPEEMADLFSDIPEALDNTVEIAKRCNLTLTLGENFLPQFPVPDGLTIEQYLENLSREGLEWRLETLLDNTAADYDEQRKTYFERLQVELDVINGMGFPGYFLIVADFIEWSKNNDVPVGPGRGSGAGSLVAYALKITDIDPLQYDLLFERFLNPERVSMPDFDIDFCMEGRDKVIEYVARTYGRESVSQIITYGTMAAKAVVRDVGRVLGHSYGFVDRVAKMIPFEVGMTLTKALEENPELSTAYKDDEEITYLLDLALSLEGLARNTGKHAGGVVIAPTVLTDFTPLYVEQGAEQLVTQFDKDDVEAVGLVKFDFLGLRTLTIIDWAVKSINRERRVKGEEPLDVNAVPLDDEETFKLLQSKNTTAVFQLESPGMKKLIARLLPDCFEDIIALVALYRPGPLQSGMVDDFIAVKKGDKPPDYILDDLEPVLKPTYGTILYQEQVMQIPQVLASYSLGGADILRRAMGKKKPEEMAKQRSIFTEGATANGVEEKTATYIFDLMEKFAGYGFNKSHSAAYALLSYQTAWLKRHHAAAFMAAVLSSDMDNTDKVVMFIEDCKQQNVDVLPPNVNRSDYKFEPLSATEVMYGLGAVKGLGMAAIEGIVAERKESGVFKDIYDFCRRVDLKKTNRRALETLIKCGALDELGPNRATLLAALPEALGLAEQAAQAKQVGQSDLFGLEVVEAADPETPKFDQVEDWPKAERLAKEKETLGLYLTGHPIDEFLGDLNQFTSGRINDVREMGAATQSASRNDGEPRRFGRNQGTDVIVAGLLFDMRQQGGKRAFLTLDDQSARIEVVLFEETFQRYRHLLEKDQVVIVEGKLAYDDFSDDYRVTGNRIRNLADAKSAYVRRIELEWQAQVGADDFVEKLEDALLPYKGGPCTVMLRYQGLGGKAELVFDEEWRVTPSEEMTQRLADRIGDRFKLIYKSPGEVLAANQHDSN